jgi:hypothetical protein
MNPMLIFPFRGFILLHIYNCYFVLFLLKNFTSSPTFYLSEIISKMFFVVAMIIFDSQAMFLELSVDMFITSIVINITYLAPVDN